MNQNSVNFICPKRDKVKEPASLWCVTGVQCISPRFAGARQWIDLRKNLSSGKPRVRATPIIATPSEELYVAESPSESAMKITGSQIHLPSKSKQENSLLNPRRSRITTTRGKVPRTIPMLAKYDMKIDNIFEMRVIRGHLIPHPNEESGLFMGHKLPYRLEIMEKPRWFPFTSRAIEPQYPVAMFPRNVDHMCRTVRSTLGRSVYDGLRLIFRICSSVTHPCLSALDFITIEKITKLLILLQPSSDIASIERNVNCLFESNVDENGFVTEPQWLNAWADSIKQGRYSGDEIQKFVEIFNQMASSSNFVEVLNDDYSDTLSHSLFSAVLRWKYWAMEQIKMDTETKAKSTSGNLTEIDNYQKTQISSQQSQDIKERHEEIDKTLKRSKCWKRGRTRKARMRKADLLDAAQELPCSGFKIESMPQAAKTIQNVLKFRELTRLKKILTEELFVSLREQFRIVDGIHGNNTGYISLEKAKRVNTLLCPQVSLDEALEDAEILFKAAEVDGYMSELQWLQGWARNVRLNNDGLGFVQDFVDDFDEMEEHANIRAILAREHEQQNSQCEKNECPPEQICQE